MHDHRRSLFFNPWFSPCSLPGAIPTPSNFPGRRHIVGSMLPSCHPTVFSISTSWGGNLGPDLAGYLDCPASVTTSDLQGYLGLMLTWGLRARPGSRLHLS